MVEIVLQITLVGLICAVNLHGLWNMANPTMSGLMATQKDVNISVPIMFWSMAVQTDVDHVDMFRDKAVPLGATPLSCSAVDFSTMPRYLVVYSGEKITKSILSVTISQIVNTVAAVVAPQPPPPPDPPNPNF